MSHYGRSEAACCGDFGDADAFCKHPRVDEVSMMTSRLSDARIMPQTIILASCRMRRLFKKSTDRFRQLFHEKYFTGGSRQRGKCPF